jgi:5-methylcytosine-specific restriction endonuclease McrA
MTLLRPKQPRIKLDRQAYEQLSLGILERDSWRCQICGRSQQLQVHHQELRSHSGSDTEENLITLCHACHQTVHRRSRLQ